MTDRAATVTADVNRIWFDSIISPNLALSRTGLMVVSLLLLVPAFVLGLFLFFFRAWPATCFVGGESLLAVAALHWCAYRLSRQSERVVLTDRDLIVERRRGTTSQRQRLEPAWVSLERQEHAEFGCEAIYLRVSRTRLRIATALGAEARGQIADALQEAFKQRQLNFHRGLDD